MTGQDQQSSVNDGRDGNRAHCHAMSVDVEDWFQVWALSRVIPRADWDSYALRVEDNTRRVLDLFARNGATATFFTLGWVAERCPALMRDIVAAGHEVGSHGYEHVKVFDQSPEEFTRDVILTRQILEDITGMPVNGYRAAGFSIDHRTPWAFGILAEAGHRYSSSLHPIAHDHYGMPDAPRFAHQPLAGSSFTEIPVSTVDAFGQRFSCAGGGWFRLLPYAWNNHLMSRLEQGEGQPLAFYFHPWEIDPGQPRAPGLDTRSRLRHYTNLSRMEGKLDRLLSSRCWRRFDETFSIIPQEAAA